jgi:hypothetical protein
MSNLEIAEMCARSGANCGSLFLDLRFRELVKTLLADHPAHLDPASLAYFMHNFSETDKLAYMGEADDGEPSPFQRINMRLFNGSQKKCSISRASMSKIPMILPLDLSTESLPSPAISYAGRYSNRSSTRFALLRPSIYFADINAIITGHRSYRRATQKNRSKARRIVTRWRFLRIRVPVQARRGKLIIVESIFPMICTDILFRKNSDPLSRLSLGLRIAILPRCAVRRSTDWPGVH